MDQVRRVRPDQMDADDAAGLRVGDDLHQPGGLAGDMGLAEPNRAKLADLELQPLLFGFLLGQPHPSDLREGEDASRDHVVAHSGRMAEDVADRDLSLRGGDMGQHRLPHDVADCIDARRRGFHPLVNKNLAPAPEAYPCLL